MKHAAVIVGGAALGAVALCEYARPRPSSVSLVVGDIKVTPSSPSSLPPCASTLDALASIELVREGKPATCMPPAGFDAAVATEEKDESTWGDDLACTIFLGGLGCTAARKASDAKKAALDLVETVALVGGLVLAAYIAWEVYTR